MRAGNYALILGAKADFAIGTISRKASVGHAAPIADNICSGEGFTEAFGPFRGDAF